jgi:TPR repeat protein
MGRYELPEIDMAVAGTAPSETAPLNGEALFELGLMYSAGNSVPVDLVSAHKWFNLAAMKGYADAARLRREIAAEMTDAEIGQAQVAARQWLKLNPEPRIEVCATVVSFAVAA